MEWLACGAGQVRYSARDYARRQGLSRNTVLADLHRLQALGALSLLVESSVALTLYGLHGLYPDGSVASADDGGGCGDHHIEAEECPAHALRHPGSTHEPPGSPFEPPPGSLFRDNEVGRSTTSPLAGEVSAGDPGANAQGPGDASTTDEPPTQLVHGQTTIGQKPGGFRGGGGFLSAQCPPH